MANIYQIRAEIENFNFEVDEETGEILNATAWDSLQMAYEEKVENIALFIKNLRNERDGIEGELETLTDRYSRLDRKIKYLEGLLTSNMGGQKFATSKCEINFRTSKAVEITNTAEIPEELMRERVTRTPNRTAIGALLKDGKEVPGCVLVERQNIKIK